MESMEKGKDSIYDFMYIDNDRVQSLLIQFEQKGLLKEIKENTSNSNHVENKIGAKAFCSYDRTALKMNGFNDEKSYDVSKSWHLQLMSYLVDSELLKTNIDQSTVGDIVLFSGTVDILDLSSIKTLFPVATAIDKNLNKDKSATKFIEMLPNSLQFIFDNESIQIWTSLNKNNLKLSPADILFAHGNCIDHTVSIIGTVEAVPNEKIRTSKDRRKIVTDLNTISKEMQGLFGRDKTQYAMTPLVIYKKIN